MTQERTRTSADALWWLDHLDGIQGRLTREPPARTAHVGCGLGLVSIALAWRYPLLLVDGWDPDDAAIAGARRNAVEAGVDDRVTFEVRELHDPGPRAGYDFVIALDALDAPGGSIPVLRALRTILAPGGTAVVRHDFPAKLGALSVETGFRALEPIDAASDPRHFRLLS